jgi:hypothetical protein
MKPTLEAERELLIAAAKAMGIEGDLVMTPVNDGDTPYIVDDMDGICWNPYRNAEQLNDMCAKLNIDRGFAVSGDFLWAETFSLFAKENYADHESKSKAAEWCALRVAAEIGGLHEIMGAY